jgi:hypothetical protein
MKNIFIFVVCGAREHIETLHFSLPYLRKFSKNEIWVLTDSSRNEVPVEHEHIIDISTPEHFDNHQASIYLKTGIYQFVPKGNKYCYLDTDIIAFSEDVDLIFNEYVAPITFAPDHCVLNKFSAYAVNCGCQDKWKIDRDKFERASLKFDRNRKIKDKRILASTQKLKGYFDSINKSPWLRLKVAFRYFTSYPIFNLSEEFSYDKKGKYWKNAQEEIILYDINPKKIEKETGFKYHKFTHRWLNNEKENIWADSCHHLKHYIETKFHIKIKDKYFQHWNGGVFLFDDTSHDFLEKWFTKTMEIFKDPQWKTRDQGTLIATVWECGLENHPILNKRWNLIADYNKLIMEWQDDEVRIDVNEKYKPVLIHVYHHFGDNQWGFWNQLMEKVNDEN